MYSYIPDAFIPQYELIKEAVVELLDTLGIAKAKESSSASELYFISSFEAVFTTVLDKPSKAHSAFQDAEKHLKAVQKDKQDAQNDLAKLFDPEFYGREGEWKKLDKECLSKEYGDYTYEVCLFGEARQKPIKGGSSFSLG